MITAFVDSATTYTDLDNWRQYLPIPPTSEGGRSAGHPSSRFDLAADQRPFRRRRRRLSEDRQLLFLDLSVNTHCTPVDNAAGMSPIQLFTGPTTPVDDW